jgi:recombination protein RecR
MYPPSIQRLIGQFSKFPTVGPRTAARFVFYLLRKPKEEIDELIQSILKLKEQIKICSFCFNSFESANLEEKLCPICSDPRRNKTLLCIVEKETDLTSIENIKKYQGLYFILGGLISSLKKADVEKLRIKELEEKVKNNEAVQEIILAINPTAEGEATTLYLERLLKPLNKKITRLGRGLPIGGELEYADEETLSSALESRR